MNRILLTLFIVLYILNTTAQTVGINTTGAVPATSAMLDVSAPNKGLLIPRVDIADLSTAAPVAAPVTSLLVYNTNSTTGEGYYYWDGTAWVKLIDATSTLDDQDWYEESTTTAPNAITDNIYTQGNVGIGTNSPLRALHIVGDGGISDDIIFESNTDNAQYSSLLTMWRSRGTNLAKTAVLANDKIGTIDGRGWNGAGWKGLAGFTILSETDLSSSVNGTIFFSTTENGSSSEKLRIKSNGNVGIGVTNPLEKLDVNGDMYLRGDDIYFSHDAGANTNNDYVHFNDINTLNFGGASIFSFHADVPRNDPAHDWSNPTGSISFDGAYATGKIGMNTTNPQASLDIENGYAISDRFWYRDYTNITTASPQVVLDRDGNPLPNNFVGLLFCSVTGTNSVGTSYWMVKRRNDNTVHLERIASFGSTGSTTPEIYNDAGVIKIRPYSTTNVYTIRVRTEQMW